MTIPAPSMTPRYRARVVGLIVPAVFGGFPYLAYYVLQQAPLQHMASFLLFLPMMIVGSIFQLFHAPASLLLGRSPPLPGRESTTILWWGISYAFWGGIGFINGWLRDRKHSGRSGDATVTTGAQVPDGIAFRRVRRLSHIFMACGALSVFMNLMMYGFFLIGTHVWAKVVLAFAWTGLLVVASTLLPRLSRTGFILGIVVSILLLLVFPIGTLIGIYGLMVLRNEDVRQLFRNGSTVQTSSAASRELQMPRSRDPVFIASAISSVLIVVVVLSVLLFGPGRRPPAAKPGKTPASTGARDKSSPVQDVAKTDPGDGLVPISVGESLFTETPALSDEDLAAWEKTHRFKAHTRQIETVVFSPNGGLLMTGSLDHTMRLWDVRTGKRLRRFIGHRRPVAAVAFSADGNYVVSGGVGGRTGQISVRLWDVKTAKELRKFVGHRRYINCVAFPPSGLSVLSGSSDGTIRLWDVETEEELKRFGDPTGEVWSVAFSPDGARVLSGGMDRTIRLWDQATGEELQRFEGHGDRVTSVAFAPDGGSVVSGSADRTIRLWDIQTGEESQRLVGHTYIVTKVAFITDRHVLSGGYASDATVRIWYVETGRELHRFNGFFRTDFSYPWLATSGDDNTVQLWRLSKK